MKSVYHYILPLLVLLLSAGYVLSRDDSTERAAQSDRLPVGTATEQTANEWSEDSTPEVELAGFVSVDREKAGDSEDESGLVDAGYHEESADAMGETPPDHSDTELSDSGWQRAELQNSEWPSEEADAFVDIAQSAKSNDRYAAAISTASVNEQSLAGQVVNITINGNEIMTRQAGQTSHEVYGNDDVADLNNSSVNTAAVNSGDVQQNNTHDTDQPVLNDTQDQASVDTTQQLNCPNSLYMGGNAYAISMLKKQGCPKPANYTGEW